MTVLARIETHTDVAKDRRSASRVKLRLGTAIGPFGASALVHDLSTTGLLFETSAELPGNRVEVQLPNVDALARIVWRQGRFIGCEFTNPIPAASVSAAMLRSDRLPRPGAPAADQNGGAATRAGGNSRAWVLAGIVAFAAVLTGAAYLFATGHVVSAIVIAAVLGGASFVTYVLNWALDNTINL